MRVAVEDQAGVVEGNLDQRAVKFGIGEAEIRQAALLGPQHLPCPAQFQIFFRDDKAILGVADCRQALPRKFAALLNIEKDTD